MPVPASTRIFIAVPDDPDAIAVLIGPLIGVPALALANQWAQGPIAVGPFSTDEVSEIAQTLRHFGLTCQLERPPTALPPRESVHVPTRPVRSAGRYVITSPSRRQPEQQRSGTSRIFRRRGSA